MIKNLNPRFRVDVAHERSTEKQIEELKRFSPVPVPELYLDMSRHGTDIEILVDNESYIRFWGADGCLEMNPAYKIQHYLGPSLAIGDDEGGKAFVLVPEKPDYPAGLYLVSWGAMNLRFGRYIAESLEDLLINGTGAEKIYDHHRK